jgi:heme/copper-type cytochrome/quinol oxidase subunit 4
MKPLQSAKGFLQRFTSDKSGLAWIWIVGLGLSIPMCVIVYWPLSYGFDMLVGVCEGMVTLTGTMAYAWITTKFIISYLLVFSLIYSVLWVITNSKHSNVWGV